MKIEVIRATETWQQAGAYYVRIQGMARQHDITLRREFDEHDTPDTKYIVLTDDTFPVATCRLYPLGDSSAMIGRVVVLPEYRGRGLGVQLLGRAVTKYRKLGRRSVRLHVAEDNKAALAFYRANGFTELSRAPGAETELLLMEKKLGRPDHAWL